ncbi:MAG: PAS domain-containing sensor histidine kinase [Desertifilum sp. SIO1I2]|nr:PAS domain-containing sensor histidine kinase [Desertifilum sp. SIO1I2]
MNSPSDRAYYQALAEDCEGWIIRYAPSLKITFVNSKLAHFLGKNPEELLDRNIFTVLPQDKRGIFLRNLQALTPKLPKIQSEEAWIDCKGSVRQVRWIGRGFFDSQGQLLEIQCLGSEITEALELQTSIENQIPQSRLESAYADSPTMPDIGELQGSFCAIASHELRLPLTAIQMAAELLQLYTLTAEEQQECFDNLNLGIQNLTQLLESMVFLERMSMAQACPCPEPIDLANFCRQLIQEFRFIDSRKHILTLICPQSSQITQLDSRLLKQALNNLLANALKYSPEGSEVQLELIYQDGNAIFKVKDRGRGIALADQKHLFRPFYRAPNVGDAPGSGLGLAIVKKCLELQGGTILIESEVGVGTTAIASIPLSPCQ